MVQVFGKVVQIFGKVVQVLARVVPLFREVVQVLGVVNCTSLDKPGADYIFVLSPVGHGSRLVTKSFFAVSGK